MKLIELFEYDNIFSMSELSELVKAVDEELKNIQSARVEIPSYKDEVGIHLNINGYQPVVVYFQLINPDHAQYQNQLKAALTSSIQGDKPEKNKSISAQLDGKILRKHALLYLIGKKRWRKTSISVGKRNYTI